jgi:hypothetical protein
MDLVRVRKITRYEANGGPTCAATSPHFILIGGLITAADSPFVVAGASAVVDIWSKVVNEADVDANC